MSLGVIIPVQDYNEVMAMPEAQGKFPTTPYALAFTRTSTGRSADELSDTAYRAIKIRLDFRLQCSPQRVRPHHS
jgi:hypothetical protein